MIVAFRSCSVASVSAAAGHIGVWPALYAGAALTCFARLAGLWQPSQKFALATMSVLLTAMGTYLIDRVKFADNLLDPADSAAQPARYSFLLARTSFWRWFAIATLATGALCGLIVSRWAPLATVASVAGVTCYASHPRRNWPRPKDLLWLKNGYVAVGLTVFIALAAVAAASPADTPVSWAILIFDHLAAIAGAAVFVTVRVLLDAALCDIDDQQTDLRFGTETAATALGSGRVRTVATIAGALLCVALLALPTVPLAMRVRWTLVSLAGVGSFAAMHPEHLKDFVDIRFPLEAATCAISALLI